MGHLRPGGLTLVPPTYILTHATSQNPSPGSGQDGSLHFDNTAKQKLPADTAPTHYLSLHIS